MIKTNVDLKPYNTFGLSVKAQKFAVFSSVEELDELLNPDRSQPILVIGGGSNLLLTKDLTQLVLKNNIKGIRCVEENENEVLIKANAGEIWHDFVLHCIENGWGGIENLSLIPGCVGAAPMQNIGAYGVEIKDVFENLEAYEIATGNLRTFSKEECAFGYRESIFKRALKGKYIIISITLRLSKNATVNTSYGAIGARLSELGITNPTIRDVSDAVVHIRQSKLPDPKQIGNSGSFFKNPVISNKQFESLQLKFPDIVSYPVDEEHVKLAAGWLIEKAGWKGKTIDQYGVHKNQALVLVNYGGAKGSDIYQLSQNILDSIEDLFGVQLEREVNVI